MAGGEHELVAVGVLRAAIVVAKAAEIGAGQMHGDVVGRVGERAAEVPGLGVVAQEHQGHARHAPDVFQVLAIGCAQPAGRRRRNLNTHRCASQPFPGRSVVKSPAILATVPPFRQIR